MKEIVSKLSSNSQASTGTHCLKSVRIRSYGPHYGPHFPVFVLNTERYYSVRMRENTGRNYSEYGHFSRSDISRLNVKRIE